MNIHAIEQSDPLWLLVAEYAETCSWSAMARMAVFMRENRFCDWERVFVAEEGGNFRGLCALVKSQGSVGFEYTPLIKWLFVEERFRGQRLGQRLIESASDYAKKIGYEQIFLTTWHKGLYEKYGFVKICDKEMREGYFEGIYGKKI